MDPQYDTSLPFRRALKQVTELNAEISAPYELPKACFLSRLEQLPFEIREQIYGYLGYTSQFRNPHKHVSYEWPTCYFSWAFGASYLMTSITNEDNYVERSMLQLNHNFLADLLELTLSGINVNFSHHLSGKRAFRIDWKAEWDMFCRPATKTTSDIKFESRCLGLLTFKFLRYVRLGDTYDRWWKPKPPIEHPVGSICFIAKHCPVLVSLHTSYLQHYVNKAPKIIEPMVIAYRRLAQSCSSLEVVGYVSTIITIYVDSDSIDNQSYANEDINLHLKEVPDTAGGLNRELGSIVTS
ncbi:Nn.00g022350.m01.CDS01 [Neocucurbitaria sp. VM-36]